MMPGCFQGRMLLPMFPGDVEEASCYDARWGRWAMRRCLFSTAAECSCFAFTFPGADRGLFLLSLSPRFIYLFIYRIPLMLYLCQIIRASSSISKNPTQAPTLPPPGGAVRVIDAQWNVSSNYNFRSKAVVNEFINRPKLEWNHTETALKLHWGWSGRIIIQFEAGQ